MDGQKLGNRRGRDPGSLTDSLTHSLSTENAGAGAVCCQFTFQTLHAIFRMQGAEGCGGGRGVDVIFYI